MTPVVLLVDDEPDVVQAIRLALRHHDYDILTATSGAEGLQLLEERVVDVLVSDEQMPGMSGSEFLRHARDRFPEVRRIVLTGHASIETTMAAINDAQVDAFLTKPCDADALAGRIDEALAQRWKDASVDVDAANRDVDEALEHLELWYQPIMTADGGVAAHEALMRPQRRVATPDALVAHATTLGRQFDLDRTVRRLAARDLGSGRVDGTVFINLLPESLGDPELLGGGDPLGNHSERVVIEITERAQVTSIGSVKPLVAGLREQGYRVAVDDLGAGYAGLTSLALLGPDIVKFDMELVRDIHLEPTKAQLVSAMVATCTDLGITTLAEGIEIPAELAALTDMGFDLYQGYLLGKPAPPA